MNLLVNKTARRAAQNYRIINQDFPWLWAIRNMWYPGGSTRIIVENGYENPALYRFFLSRDPESNELWVRYSANNGDEREEWIKVKRIENAQERNVNWACKIVGQLFSGYIVRDIVIVCPPNSRGDRETFTIYRIKEKDWNNFRIRLDMFASPDLFPKVVIRKYSSV